MGHAIPRVSVTGSGLMQPRVNRYSDWLGYMPMFESVFSALRQGGQLAFAALCIGCAGIAMRYYDIWPVSELDAISMSVIVFLAVGGLAILIAVLARWIYSQIAIWRASLSAFHAKRTAIDRLHELTDREAQAMSYLLHHRIQHCEGSPSSPLASMSLRGFMIPTAGFGVYQVYTINPILWRSRDRVLPSLPLHPKGFYADKRLPWLRHIV